MPSTYQVQRASRYGIIAARYNRSVDETAHMNDLSLDDVIQPGDVLVVNPPTPIPTSTLVLMIAASFTPAILHLQH